MGGTREVDQLRAGQTTFMVRWATFTEEMPEMAAAGLERAGLRVAAGTSTMGQVRLVAILAARLHALARNFGGT